MKKQTALLTTIAFLFTSASSGTITMPHAEETQTQQQTDVSAGLSIKALTAKAVDENPYMSNGDTNIHHDCYNTDTTDAVLPIGIYPEINVSFEKTNANASPAIFFAWWSCYPRSKCSTNSDYRIFFTNSARWRRLCHPKLLFLRR